MVLNLLKILIALAAQSVNQLINQSKSLVIK